MCDWGQRLFVVFVVDGTTWLMVSHKQTTIKHSILKALYNKQFSPAKVVIDVS
jgi:hypothetical protein